MLMLDITLRQYQPPCSSIIKLQKGETSSHPTLEQHASFCFPHDEALLNLATLIDIIIVLQEQIQFIADLLRRIELLTQDSDIREMVELGLGSVYAKVVGCA